MKLNEIVKEIELKLWKKEKIKTETNWKEESKKKNGRNLREGWKKAENGEINFHCEKEIKKERKKEYKRAVYKTWQEEEK